MPTIDDEDVGVRRVADAGHAAEATITNRPLPTTHVQNKTGAVGAQRLPGDVASVATPRVGALQPPGVTLCGAVGVQGKHLWGTPPKAAAPALLPAAKHPNNGSNTAQHTQSIQTLSCTVYAKPFPLNVTEAQVNQAFGRFGRCDTPLPSGARSPL